VRKADGMRVCGRRGACPGHCLGLRPRRICRFRNGCGAAAPLTPGAIMVAGHGVCVCCVCARLCLCMCVWGGFPTSQVMHRIFERIDYKKDNKIDKEEVLTPHLSSLATLLCICTRTGV
jgi:hypothetical protein